MFDTLKYSYYIMIKDAKAYYLKPPNIIMGILFPITLLLTFSLRMRGDMREAIPGLIAMAIFFGTTSMEIAVIVFERGIGSFERLFLAPISFITILVGKILGGAIFGVAVSLIISLSLSLFFDISIAYPLLFIISIIISAFTFAAFGAFLATVSRESANSMIFSALARFPMLFLSGIFFPIALMPTVLKIPAYLSPLTYGVDSMRQAMLDISHIADIKLCLLALFLIGVIFIIISARLLKRLLI